MRALPKEMDGAVHGCKKRCIGRYCGLMTEEEKISCFRDKKGKKNDLEVVKRKKEAAQYTVL